MICSCRSRLPAHLARELRFARPACVTAASSSSSSAAAAEAATEAATASESSVSQARAGSSAGGKCLRMKGHKRAKARQDVKKEDIR